MKSLSPSEVVRLHDTAYGPTDIDYAAWIETLTFPFTMISRAGDEVFDGPEAIERQLRGLDQVARSDGIIGLRTRILSEVEITDGIAIVTSHRDRLARSGPSEGVLGTTPITFTLVKTDDGWKINRIFFDGHRYEEISPSRASADGSNGAGN